MPELPEVEVVKMGLESQVLGKVFQSIEVRMPKICVNPAAEVQDTLAGQAMTEVSRRAKYLLIHFETHVILVHLRMTGQVMVQLPDAELKTLPFTYYRRDTDTVDKHVHVILNFEDGSRILYRDIRQFGRLEMLAKAHIAQHKALQKLGVEPLGENFTLSHLKTLLQSKRQMKPLLLDQSKIAGLGNIYVDEALFQAGIKPRREARSLKAKEVKKLHEAIPQILRKAIAAGGTTLSDYMHVDGSKGKHQEELLVYGRTGQPCVTCGRELIRDIIAQRSTHYCGHCQK